MIVKKFGGSSLADAEKIRQTVEIVKQNKDSSLCLVLSAMKGITNTLVKAAKLAEKGDDSYHEHIEMIKTTHRDCLNDLFDSVKPEDLEKIY